MLNDDFNPEVDHKHLCPECRYCYHHATAEIVDNTAAHACPNCGHTDYIRYYGQCPSLGRHVGPLSGAPDTDASLPQLTVDVQLYTQEGKEHLYLMQIVPA